MQRPMHPISALQIPTSLDVQRKLRDCDQNHHLPNLNLIGEVELPEVEEGVELLLAAGEKEIDPTSEASEVALEGAEEGRIEVAFHLDNFGRH